MSAAIENQLNAEGLDWYHDDSDNLLVFSSSENDGCFRKYEFKLEFPSKPATTEKTRERRRAYRRAKQCQDKRPGKRERDQYKTFIDNLEATMNQHEHFDPSTVKLPEELQNCAKLQRDLKRFLAQFRGKTNNL